MIGTSVMKELKNFVFTGNISRESHSVTRQQIKIDTKKSDHIFYIKTNFIKITRLKLVKK